MTRLAALIPDGVPRYIRCYDDGGKSFDRYTVVFTGRYRKRTGGEFVHLGMSEYPCHPQGFGQHLSSREQIDRPSSGHLGKRIPFNALPEECRKLVLSDYKDLWNLTTEGKR